MVCCTWLYVTYLKTKFCTLLLGELCFGYSPWRTPVEHAGRIVPHFNSFSSFNLLRARLLQQLTRVLHMVFLPRVLRDIVTVQAGLGIVIKINWCLLRLKWMCKHLGIFKGQRSNKVWNWTWFIGIFGLLSLLLAECNSITVCATRSQPLYFIRYQHSTVLI